MATTLHRYQPIMQWLIVWHKKICQLSYNNISLPCLSRSIHWLYPTPIIIIIIILFTSNNSMITIFIPDYKSLVGNNSNKEGYKILSIAKKVIPFFWFSHPIKSSKDIALLHRYHSQCCCHGFVTWHPKKMSTFLIAIFLSTLYIYICYSLYPNLLSFTFFLFQQQQQQKDHIVIPDYKFLL